MSTHLGSVRQFGVGDGRSQSLTPLPAPVTPLCEGQRIGEKKPTLLTQLTLLLVTRSVTGTTRQPSK